MPIKLKINHLHITFVLLIIFLQKVSSQKEPFYTFGKIDKSLLEMKVYDKDSTADAVVLYDHGELDKFSFTRKYRLKILKKSGCDRANFIMYVQGKSDIKGTTYNLVNGEIVKTKLKNESIYEEEVENRQYRYKVAMPNVQVGSIIDIQYSFDGIPDTWYFQRDIPVVWSELRLYNGPEIGIEKISFGFHKFSINEEGHWVCKDVPALKQEPYMNNPDNYLTKFELEFSYVNLPGYFSQFATSWEAINHYLLSKSTLGKELGTISFMNDEAKSISETFQTEKEKSIAAYETIKKRIKWNNEKKLYPETGSSIKIVLNRGTGNAGEVNTALLLLLRKLDIKATPVALSTRDNGLLTHYFPALHKLNYLIVLAKIDGQDVLLDATDELLPMGYLPQRCINGNGDIVMEQEDPVQPSANSKHKPLTKTWVDLKSGGVDKIKQYVTIDLSKEGKIAGEIDDTRKEFAAYLFRKKYSEYNDKNDYIKEIERTNPGLKILGSEINAIDSIYKPVNIHHSFEYKSDDLDFSDSTFAFLPVFFDRLTSNPFKLDIRTMPVDFIYPFNYTYICNFKIPQGYMAQSLPTELILTLPGNGGKYIFRNTANDTTVQVYSNFFISKSVFDQTEYVFIKQMFADIIKKEAEPVVLRKKREY